MRVVLVVQIGGRAESIIDGMATNVETRPGEGGVSQLVVKGKDLSALMDLIELNGVPYPAMPPAVRVLIVLAKYAALGVIPMVIPSIVEDVPIPLDRIPLHRGTDYAYVKKLAHGVRLRLLPRARPGPRHVEGLLGPGDPRRRAAAGADR